MEQSKALSHVFIKGIFSENPVLRLMLGVVPALAVTVTARYGLYMGLAVFMVLLASNLAVAVLAKFVSERAMLGSSLLLIAGFVVMLQMLMQAFVPEAAAALGVFLPLIVVNTLLLGRAGFSAKSGGLRGLVDAFGMGLGFVLALVLVGSLREILGAGTWFGFEVMPESFQTMEIFNMAPGAFFALAVLMAVANKIFKQSKGGA